MVITNKAKDTINHQQSDKVKYAPQKCWGTVMAPNGLANKSILIVVGGGWGTLKSDLTHLFL
jgi:hypothetical protein